MCKNLFQLYHNVIDKQTNRQTDRQTDERSRRYLLPCSAELARGKNDSSRKWLFHIFSSTAFLCLLDCLWL